VAWASVAALPAAAITLAPGFSVEPLPFVFDVPTAIAFLPDGALLVAEKGGIVYVVRGDQRHVFWSHEEEVLNTDDRGLLAVEVDPDFETNRHVYFLYTVDPDSNGVELDLHDDAFGRLVRYTVSAAHPNVVDESSRTVLVGATWATGFPSGSGTHHVAGLAWGADGTLFVGAGDGAHFEGVDAGGQDPGLFAPGRTDPDDDIGAFRAQDLGSLAGKILRVDPATGLGLESNPYFDGDPASVRSRVWAYGLRNPFRIARRPGTGSSDPAAGDPGTLYIADVGWDTWEEVDVADAPGRNFGWPCFEGPEGRPDYQSATPSHHGCGSLGSPANPAVATRPAAAFHRDLAGASIPPGMTGGVIAGGVFYDGTSYPSPCRGAYVMGDYGKDWIQVLRTDESDQVIQRVELATDAGRPVAFASDPSSGDLFYVAIAAGEIRRIRHVGPVAVDPAPPARISLSAAHPNPTRGAVTFTLDLRAPARVAFSIHDVAGRVVWRAAERDLASGRHSLLWSPGPAPPAGVCFASVRGEGFAAVRRFVVTR
jgi:glucose/arabinose dehydrogenase